MPGQEASAEGRPALPALFQQSKSRPELCYQGAEALLYRTYFPIFPESTQKVAAEGVSATPNATIKLPSHDAFLKHRPPKPYRHPILDAKLTRHRILAEARVLVKLHREGVAVPAVYAMDWEVGWMIGEWIDGGNIRALLDDEVPVWLSGEYSEEKESRLFNLMGRVGTLVGRMHDAGVVHGDLTTSNLMLRSSGSVHESNVTAGKDAASGYVVLIDFGLASQSKSDEDRAVDLYVLERAFGSIHPQTERLFETVLQSYGKSYKTANIALKRLEEVRMRGRKKIAIG